MIDLAVELADYGASSKSPDNSMHQPSRLGTLAELQASGFNLPNQGILPARHTNLSDGTATDATVAAANWAAIGIQLWPPHVVGLDGP